VSRFLVTIAPPTPNGDLHLGHLSGPVLAADVFARGCRLLGHEVVFLSYSDDYQSYLARKAREVGTCPDALAAKNASRIAETLRMAGIDLDVFLKARQTPHYARAVKLFYERAVERGVVRTRTEQVARCGACDVWGYEAFGRGRCNHCGEPSDASQCEGCAETPDVLRMGSIHCMVCKEPMHLESVTREYLHLDDDRAFLANIHERTPRPWLRKFVEGVLSQGALDWGLTRPNECGVDIEHRGSQKRVHTWFGGMPGYFAAFEQFAESRGGGAMVDAWWRSKDTRIVHFLGFDCAFSHAIVYPTLLRNFGEFTTDVTVIPNMFLKLNGGDFSTSRGHAIWIRDMLAELDRDCLRLYLASISPETATTNFDTAAFWAWKKVTYDDMIGAIEETLRTSAAKVPILLEAPQKEVAEAFRRQWVQALAPDTFSMRSVATSAVDLFRVFDAARRDRSPAAEGLLAIWTGLAEPLQPDLATSVRRALGVSSSELHRWAAGQNPAPFGARAA
jgi:methionyl-tRNA synthetase